jgi:hypothetical protein
LQKVAALLHAADLHDQDVFNHGVTVVLNRGQPNSFPAFSAWFQRVSNGQLPAISSAGTQAGDLLPDSTAVTDWQNQDLNMDIDQLAQDGLDVGGPSDATGAQEGPGGHQAVPVGLCDRRARRRPGRPRQVRTGPRRSRQEVVAIGAEGF